MAPKPTLSERLDALVDMVSAQADKAEAADVRMGETISVLTARVGKLEEAAANAPKVPDTAWSALVALVRVAGSDALTVRLLVGGGLGALTVLGLAALALLNEHPELLGVING